MSSEKNNSGDVNNTSIPIPTSNSLWNKKVNPLYKDESSLIGKKDESINNSCTDDMNEQMQLSLSLIKDLDLDNWEPKLSPSTDRIFMGNNSSSPNTSLVGFNVNPPPSKRSSLPPPNNSFYSTTTTITKKEIQEEKKKRFSVPAVISRTSTPILETPNPLERLSPDLSSRYMTYPPKRKKFFNKRSSTEKYKLNEHGKKTLQFRTSYLNWCEKLKVQPAPELLRSLKIALRNQTPFVRLSICHAGVDNIHVQALVQALKTHDGINEILLNHNGISDTGAQTIAEVLRTNKTITSMELFGNRIGDESQKIFAKMLKENTTLKRLKLGDNLIGPRGAELLAKGISKNTTLTQLHLGGNKIQVQGLKYIAQALVKNTTLTSLGLRDNAVGPQGMEALADTLRQKSCALSDIQLKGNHIMAQGAICLSKALSVNRSLKVLELQSNSIGHVGVKVLCEALRDNPSVHALNFNDNELGDEGAEAVAKLLQANPAITTLGLANNKIRKKGAASLAEALKHKNSAVTGLDLGNNELGNGGAVAIAEALKVNKVLTSLDLRSCEIHLKGILSLAEMAGINSSLRHLDLGANYAKNQGAIAWARVLATNTSLTRLCLTDNQIYHEGGESLAQALSTNYTLRNFSYGGQGPSANRIDSAIRRVIDSIVAENKRNWEQSVAKDGNPSSTPTKVTRRNSGPRAIRNFVPSSQSELTNQQLFDTSSNLSRNRQYQTYPGGYRTKQQLLEQRKMIQNNPQTYSTTGLPTWFTSLQMPRPPINPQDLHARLVMLFKNKLLKAENPKFPGCYFIGNIINTLRKVFPDTRIDEVQLVQFAYNHPSYYVHLSREMVKTQIKYLGEPENKISNNQQTKIGYDQFGFKTIVNTYPGRLIQRSPYSYDVNSTSIQQSFFGLNEPNFFPTSQQGHSLFNQSNYSQNNFFQQQDQTDNNWKWNNSSLEFNKQRNSYSGFEENSLFTGIGVTHLRNHQDEKMSSLFNTQLKPLNDEQQQYQQDDL